MDLFADHEIVIARAVPIVIPDRVTSFFTSIELPLLSQLPVLSVVPHIQARMLEIRTSFGQGLCQNRSECRRAHPPGESCRDSADARTSVGRGGYTFENQCLRMFPLRSPRLGGYFFDFFSRPAPLWIS
jgi:hypothetical protein